MPASNSSDVAYDNLTERKTMPDQPDKPYVNELLNQTPFDIPEIHEGDCVLVSRDNTWATSSTGFVAEVKGRFVDVNIMGAQRLMKFYDCLHDGDPWITERPELFAEQEQRAIVRIAPSTLAVREIMKLLPRLQALTPDDSSVSAVTTQLTALEKRIKQLETECDAFTEIEQRLKVIESKLKTMPKKN